MYGRMVRYLSDRYYRQVSRYTTSAFMRMKLGETLSRRGLSAYVFETRREAVDFSKKQGQPHHHWQADGGQPSRDRRTAASPQPEIMHAEEFAGVGPGVDRAEAGTRG
jgi:hypothetical protein